MKILGIDIGGTKIETALVEKYEVSEVKKEPVDKSDLIGQIIRLAKSYPDSPPIGIGMAGQIKEGTLISSPNLPIKQFPLVKELEAKLFRPVTLLNDVQAAALAEAQYGKGKDTKRLLVVFLGTGIGGGLVIDGKLQTGGAGELGHTVIQQNGPKCTCGRKGCLEVFASGWGLAKLAEVNNAKEALQNEHIDVAERGFQALTTAFANVANFLNPDKIILGGNLLKGYERVFPSFIKDLEEAVRKEVFIPNGEDLTFEKSAFPSTAVLIGAACHAHAAL